MPLISHRLQDCKFATVVYMLSCATYSWREADIKIIYRPQHNISLKY